MLKRKFFVFAIFLILIAFSAPTFSQDTWKFIIYGDTRTDDAAHRSVLQSMRDNSWTEDSPDYDFIINVGDVIENGSNTKQWDKWQSACDDILGGTGQNETPPKYMACPGNHENLSGKKAVQNWRRFLKGQQQYGNDGKFFVLDHKNARFIILNSAIDVIAPDGTQYDMLLDAIQNNPMEWLFAVWHHPIFDFGTKGYRDDIHDQWGIELFNNGCDIMFVGHSHHYVRTKKLKLNGDINPPLHPTNGTAQIVAGNGGAPIATVYPDKDGNEDMVAEYASKYGYTEFTVNVPTTDTDKPTMNMRHILVDETSPFPFDEATYTPNPKTVGTPQYTLNVDIVGGGTVVPNGGSYKENSEVTLEAKPSPNWTFEGWSGDIVTDNTIKMDQNKFITATFTYNSTNPLFAFASNDIPVTGTVSGTYVDTKNNDGAYESITEKSSKGKPSSRYNTLEHKWVFNNVMSGSTFNLVANCTSGESFIFEYSTDDNKYISITDVTNTTDYQSAQIELDYSTVYVRVTDYDQTPGNEKATINVDYMCFQYGLGKPVYPQNHNESINTVDDYHILNSYPNPFNPTTKINYKVLHSGKVYLKIYDVKGNLVSTLVDEHLSEGSYTYDWNTIDSQGNQLPSGTYICRLNNGTVNKSIKLMLIR